MRGTATHLGRGRQHPAGTGTATSRVGKIIDLREPLPVGKTVAPTIGVGIHFAAGDFTLAWPPLPAPVLA